MPTFTPDDLPEPDMTPSDKDLYGPGGIPWCTFRAGTLACVNGDKCKNPSHNRR